MNYPYPNFQNCFYSLQNLGFVARLQFFSDPECCGTANYTTDNGKWFGHSRSNSRTSRNYKIIHVSIGRTTTSAKWSCHLDAERYDYLPQLLDRYLQDRGL
jgi:hypothetical protein